MLSIGLFMIISAVAFLVSGYCMQGFVAVIFSAVSALLSTIGAILIIYNFIKRKKNDE
jgi:putative Mn2+ efflux pump MntP